MEICGLMNERHIIFDLDPGEKEDVLKNFVKVLDQRGVIAHPEPVLREILKREELGSTGLERGIAVPHALTDNLEKPFLALAVIREGMDFESVDQLPTHVLLLLLGSRDSPGTQLKILAHICRLVKETELVERIRQCSTPREICDVIGEEERKII